MLHLHHSNALHALSRQLIDVLQTSSIDVMQPQVIVVQNPGMKRWLQHRITGVQGIAANLLFPLPSRLIWDIFLSQFDQLSIHSVFDSPVLRWRLLELLQHHREYPHLQEISGYLEQDSNGLASLQLAERLALLFDQYLVYRPDWIRQWEQSQHHNRDDESWQASLWQQLRQQSDQPHRADLIQQLLQRLQQQQLNTDGIPHQIHIFAISSLSPLYQQVLIELSRHIDVHFYLLNPCQEYWGDIQSKRQKIMDQNSTENNDEDSGLHENGLLASLGQQGREFIDAFYEWDTTPQEWMGFEDLQHPTSLLQHLQGNILNLTETRATPPLMDNSIRVVRCYSEIRELQVLHDNLLQHLQKDPELQPHDIVVMTPDINILAPYIHAVFGQQPDQRRIPYSISDQSELNQSPLLQTVVEWLLLPGCRFTANDIMAWLELPALQRACQFQAEDMELIEFWIRENHIHWGYDAEQRASLGLPAWSLHSWMFGIERLFSACLMPRQQREFAGHVLSDSQPGQSDLIILGKLQHMLDRMLDWSRRLQQPKTIAQWQQDLLAMMEQLLQPNDDELWQLKPLRDELASWLQQTESINFDQLLNHQQVHYLLNQSLSQSSTHHQYLNGSVTFCNLIPMRAIPFKIVCLLGMGNAQFPRSDIAPQFDLIAAHPRRGDRSRREDDRYMFLQSLLSARDQFYLSYVGLSQQDDSELEPSVIVTELLDHIEQLNGVRLDVDSTSLHAFSDRAFEQGSYATQWLAPDSPLSTGSLIGELPSDSDDKELSVIELESLLQFYRNPAKYFLRQGVGIHYDQRQQLLDDDEPFDVGGLDRFQLRQQLINDWSEQGLQNPQQWLNSGLLPAGELGKLTLRQQQQQLQLLFNAMQADDSFNPSISMFDGNLAIGQHDLTGQIASYGSDTLIDFVLSQCNGKTRYLFWLQHCFVNALGIASPSRLYYLDKGAVKSISYQSMDPIQAQQFLQTAMTDYLKGHQQLMPLYLNSAYDYLLDITRHGENVAVQKLNQKWFGENFQTDFEVADEYIQASLKAMPRDLQSLPDEFFELTSRHLQTMMEHQL